MGHFPPFIEDLALILAAAGVVTLLFKKFKQPIVLGYIIAGFLVGPYCPFFPTIGDPENIRVWAEMGVIFLLFSLGLEFSFRKLMHVGGPASITAIVEVVSMASIGYFAGKMFGWNNMDSVFLGGILSISSTTIIIRAFDEVGVKGRGFVGLVLGILIVEDLIAVLLMVLLSTVALSQSFAGTELLLAMGKLLFFLILWFVSGIFVLPTALNRLRGLLNPETLLIVSISLCFLMVILASQAGFSPALGAFMMGSILAETREGRRIEHIIEPVRNLFAAIFFVSVGMLIDPDVISKFATPIVVITFVTIVGKVLSTSLGVILSGRSVRHAVQSGVSLAQIGEFSFIIAGLGISLKVTSDFLYPIAVGVSAITTFTTPYLIRSSDSIAEAIERRLPHRWKLGLQNYAQAIGNVSFTSQWSGLVRTYSWRIVLNAVIVIAIFSGTSRLLSPVLAKRIEDPSTVNVVGLVISLVLAAPFFWAMVSGRRKNSASMPRTNSTVAFEVFRWVLGLFLISILSTEFISLKVAAGLFLSVGLTLLFIFAKHLEGLYSKLEGLFVENLSANHSTGNPMPALAPWDAHLASLEVSPGSEVVGKTLEQSRIRERFGIIIALIERGGKRIPAPNRNELIFPFDNLYVIGTDEQIVKFREQIEQAPTYPAEMEDFNYVLIPHLVVKSSPYCQKSIRDSGIRERTHGLIVGIERKGKRTLNPDSNLSIEEGDLLWIVGERNSMKGL